MPKFVELTDKDGYTMHLNPEAVVAVAAGQQGDAPITILFLQNGWRQVYSMRVDEMLKKLSEV